MVQMGFTQTNEGLSKVLDSVRQLNVGVKDVVVGTKGLNSEVEKLGKQMSASEKKNGLLKSIQKMASFTTVIQGFSSGIKSLYSGLEKGFLSVGKAAGEADKIYKTSQLVGMSVKGYQAFASAAKHSGIEIGEMDDALRKFNLNLFKARSGDKTAYKMFDSVLPKGAKLSDYKDSVTLITAIADSYKKLGTAEQKAFVTQGLFGKGGSKMATLLSDGGTSVQKMIADYGNVGFSDKGVLLARDFNDELQTTGELLGSFKITVMEELFPTFINLFKTIQGYVKENGNELRTSIKETVSSITEFAKGLLPKIPVILDKIRGFVEFVGPKKTLFAGVFFAALPALTQVAIGIKALFVFIKSIFGVVVPLTVKFLGLVKGVGLWLRKWLIILKFVTALKGIALGALGLIVIKIAAVTAGIMGWIYTFKSIYKNWDMLKLFMKDILGGIGDWFSMIGDKVLGLFDWVGDAARGLAEKISGFFMNALSGLLDFVSGIKNSILGLFSGFPDKVKSFFGLGDINANVNGSSSPQTTLAASAAQAISESHTTVTNRFAVDFTNVPRGAKITPPPKGDFDWSRGYMLGGV